MAVNFDAKVRRNSTDREDLFIAHVSGMDMFARALVSADKILSDSPYLSMLTDRYATFGGGRGKFCIGSNDIRATCQIGCRGGEPLLTSGKQELYEALINQYM